jgi:hypothetical protein
MSQLKDSVKKRLEEQRLRLSRQKNKQRVRNFRAKTKLNAENVILRTTFLKFPFILYIFAKKVK